MIALAVRLLGIGGARLVLGFAMYSLLLLALLTPLILIYLYVKHRRNLP